MRTKIIVILLLSVFGNSLSAQINRNSFQSIGPTTMGGRIVDLAVNHTNPTEFYLAYATGGLWYTSNNGHSFTSVFDSADVLTIGAIAINWQTGTIWVGTGEPNASQDSRAGTGIYKSENRGKSWQHIGLEGSNQIGKILLHPRSNAIVYVAAMGHTTGGGKKGVYKTGNGGKTWERKLFIDDTTGAIDLVMNPKNPDEMYAAMWHRVRRPWNHIVSGISSGIYKSIDGGDHWISLSNQKSGLPVSDGISRIGLSISAKNPKILYAVVVNRSLVKQTGKMTGVEVYKTDNSGTTWQKVNNRPVQGGTYFGKITVSPTNKKKVVVLGEILDISNDGGNSFAQTADHTVMHVDHHALWINPSNDLHMITGTDGGCNITYDGGKHWTRTASPPVGQFYSVTTDDSEPYNVYGALQDNGIWFGPSDYDNEILRYYLEYPYRMLVDNDGMMIEVDRRDNTTVYAGNQYGQYFRLNRQKDVFKQSIGDRYKRRSFAGLNAERIGMTVRFNWKTPILLSRHNQDILYLGANRFFRSLNKADTLIALSKDLTNGPKEGNIAYGTITSIAESPLRFGLLYVGTDDGNIQLSMDGGYNWKLLNDSAKDGIIPKQLNVTSISASRYNEGTVFAALNGRGFDNLSPFLFTSDNYGKSWKQIGNDLPREPINVVKEDPKNENIIYVGTDGGLYVSFNKGLAFEKWYAGIPKSVIISDIAIQERENEIVIATYGRSLYKAKLDEIQKLASTQHNK